MSTTKYGHLSMINSSFAVLKRRDWEEVQYIMVTFYEGIPGRVVAPARAPKDIPKDLNITQRKVSVWDSAERSRCRSTIPRPSHLRLYCILKFTEVAGWLAAMIWRRRRIDGKLRERRASVAYGLRQPVYEQRYVDFDNNIRSRVPKFS
jgi:hypothetical protein